MSKLFAALAALIVLVVAILLLAPNLVPTESYRGQIEQAATTALGRDVAIDGDISFTIVPKTGFSAEGLTIANADGFDGPPLAKVAKATIGVELAPLLSRNVRISNFVLTEPEIALEISETGAVNWNFAAPQEAASTEPGNAQPGLNDLRLGDVRIVNGAARLDDRKADQSYIAEDINVRVRLESLAEPLEAGGTMTFQGAPANIDLVITTLADYLGAKPANLKLDAALGDAEIGADLVLEKGDALQYSGPISLNAPDLPALARLFAVELEDAPGFDRLSASGQAAGGDDGVRFTDAEIGFDDIAASGDLGLNWGGARPKATGSLRTALLDLRPYLPEPTAQADGFPEWSTAPLDFASLNNVDAEIDLRADAIYLNDIKTGESRMRIVISDGRLTADLPTLNLYGGSGSGRLVVNAAGNTPSMSGAFNLGAVNAEPFSRDVLKNDRLLGIGSLDFEFAAAGASQAAIMASLDGEGGFNLADGALKGVDIVKLVNGVREAIAGGAPNPAALATIVSEARNPTERTDYSRFVSAFKMDDGVVSAPTIALEGPFLAMDGDGKVNLPNQTIDLRLRPTASAEADRTGQSLTVPVRIGGTFAAPTIAIDAESLIRGQVEERGRKLLDRVIGGEKEETQDAVRGVFDSLVGGEKSAAGESDDDASGADAEEALQGLAAGALGRLFGGDEEEPTDDAEGEKSPE